MLGGGCQRDTTGGLPPHFGFFLGFFSYREKPEKGPKYPEPSRWKSCGDLSQGLEREASVPIYAALYLGEPCLRQALPEAGI